MDTSISILEVPLLVQGYEIDLRSGIVGGGEITNEDLIHGYDPYFYALCYIPHVETARNLFC